MLTIRHEDEDERYRVEQITFNHCLSRLKIMMQQEINQLIVAMVIINFKLKERTTEVGLSARNK